MTPSGGLYPFVLITLIQKSKSVNKIQWFPESTQQAVFSKAVF